MSATTTTLLTITSSGKTKRPASAAAPAAPALVAAPTARPGLGDKPYTGTYKMVVDAPTGVARVQAIAAEGDDVDTLTVDLRKGAVTYGPQPGLPRVPSPGFHAIVGVLRLPSGGAALALVTASEYAGALGGEGGGPYMRPEIRRVTDTIIVTDEAGPPPSAEDQRMLAFFRDALNAEGAGRGVYYSLGGHLTLSAQKTRELPRDASPMPARAADRRFFWNRALAQPLLDAGADKYVSTMIMGSVRAFEIARLPAVDGAEAGGAVLPPSLRAPGSSATVTVDVTLIARRGVDRIGTRYWHRGADPDTAAVANFVESEQLVMAQWDAPYPDGGASSSPSSYVASLVQVRGSMPMVWTQTPDGAFKPPTVLLDGKGTQRVFDEHATLLLEKYVGSPEANVTLVNLVNHKGSEGALEQQYGAEAARFDAGANNGGKEKNSVPPLHYVGFDFHKECEGDYDAGLAKLWQLISNDFDRQGMWTRLEQPAPSSSRPVAAAANGKSGSSSSIGGGVQVGVMRTNCIDCLDRTNVGQSLVGRKALARALAAAGVISGADAADPGAGPLMPTEAFEQAFRNLWADHGDDISRQYAGTAALKSEFTRTGKRTPKGYVEDALKSTKRYFVNNFFDGRKQDALDLATGAYVPAGKKAAAAAAGYNKAASSSSSSTSPVVGMIIVAAVVLMAMAARAGAGAAALFPSSSSTSAAAALFLPLLAAASSSSSSSSPSPLGDPSILTYLLAALVLLAILYVFVAPKLVTPPTLCPQLADTVNVCVKRGDGVARDLSHDGKAQRGAGKKNKAE